MGDLSSQLSLDLEATTLFDHPTLDSIASFLAHDSVEFSVEGKEGSSQAPLTTTTDTRKIVVIGRTFSLAG